jgi:hypothetical protein
MANLQGELTEQVIKLSRHALDKARETSPELAEILRGARIDFLPGGEVQVRGASEKAAAALRQIAEKAPEEAFVESGVRGTKKAADSLVIDPNRPDPNFSLRGKPFDPRDKSQLALPPRPGSEPMPALELPPEAAKFEEIRGVDGFVDDLGIANPEERASLTEHLRMQEKLKGDDMGMSVKEMHEEANRWASGRNRMETKANPAGVSIDKFVSDMGITNVDDRAGLSQQLRMAEKLKGAELTSEEMQTEARRFSSSGGVMRRTTPEAPAAKPEDPRGDVARGGGDVSPMLGEFPEGKLPRGKLAVGAVTLGGAAAAGAAKLASDSGEEKADASVSPEDTKPDEPAAPDAGVDAPGGGSTEPGDKPAGGGGVNLPPTKSNPSGDPKKLGDAQTFDQYMEILRQQEPTGKMDWTEEDEKKWRNDTKLLRDAYYESKRRNEWLEVAEMVGHALSQFFAARQGLRTGVDATTGLKFNKVDWARKQDQLLGELKMELGIQEDAKRDEQKRVLSLRDAHNRWRQDFSSGLAAKARFDASDAARTAKQQLPKETPETKALAAGIKKDKDLWAQEAEEGGKAVSLLLNLEQLSGKERKKAKFDASVALGKAGVDEAMLTQWRGEASEEAPWHDFNDIEENKIFAKKLDAHLKQRNQERSTQLDQRIANLNQTMMGGSAGGQPGAGGDAPRSSSSSGPKPLRGRP